jgi:hypothetical protein
MVTALLILPHLPCTIAKLAGVSIRPIVFLSHRPCDSLVLRQGEISLGSHLEFFSCPDRDRIASLVSQSSALGAIDLVQLIPTLWAIVGIDALANVTHN